MTSCFVCPTLNLGRKKSTGTEPKSVLGVEVRIRDVIEFEAGGEQPKMADDELVAMDLSR